MIYFRCYIEAFNEATTDLSILEDGTYNRLLRHYYQKEAPLPLDADRLARICRAITLEERAAIAAVLDRYFKREEDGYHNERADHEIAVSRQARENGSRGGRPGNGVTGPETGSGTESKTGSITGQLTGAVTGDQTGSGHPSNQNNPLNLSTSQPTTQPPAARASRRAAQDRGVGVEAWEAYRGAYLQRYGIEPVRNAKANTNMAQLVKALGPAEAPPVAAFYVTHSRAVYVANKHPTNLLVRDAEGLRTDWATARRTGETEARQADRTQATGNAFAPLLAEARKVMA